jgi:hypothetical protein
MAAPNLLLPSTINGKTVAMVAPTSATNLLVNASSSNKLLRVTSIVVANVTGSAASITLQWFNAATGGTAFHVAKTLTVPSNDRVTLVSADTPINLEENTRLSVTAGTASALEVVCSYEDIS